MEDASWVWAAASCVISLVALGIAFRANWIAGRAPLKAVDQERRGQLLRALEEVRDETRAAMRTLSGAQDAPNRPACIEATQVLTEHLRLLYMAGKHKQRLRLAWLAMVDIDRRWGAVVFTQDRVRAATTHDEKMRHDYPDSDSGERAAELVQSRRERDAAVADFTHGLADALKTLDEEINNLTTDERQAR